LGKEYSTSYSVPARRWVVAEESDGRQLEEELAGLRARLADDERCLKGLKQAEDALLLAEERFRFIADNVADIVFTIDATGIVTYMNRSIERVSNFKVSELLGQPFLRFIHPDDLEGLLVSLERTLSGKREPLEYRVIDKGGMVYHVRTFSFPHFRGEEYEGLTGIMTVLGVEG
jgi:PAS domain S-box-containing protein